VSAIKQGKAPLQLESGALISRLLKKPENSLCSMDAFVDFSE